MVSIGQVDVGTSSCVPPSWLGSRLWPWGGRAPGQFIQIVVYFVGFTCQVDLLKRAYPTVFFSQRPTTWDGGVAR